MRAQLGSRLHSKHAAPAVFDLKHAEDMPPGPRMGWFGPYGDWDPRPAPDFNWRSLSRGILRQALKDVDVPKHAAEAAAWFGTEQCEDLCQLLKLDVKKVRHAATVSAGRAALLALLRSVEASERGF